MTFISVIWWSELPCAECAASKAVWLVWQDFTTPLREGRANTSNTNHMGGNFYGLCILQQAAKDTSPGLLCLPMIAPKDAQVVLAES